MFQELELVGAFPATLSVIRFVTNFKSFATEDPDLEDAPILPEMGTIELRAYRCHVLSDEEYEYIDTPRLHGGRASERSKQSGWHRVRYYYYTSKPPVQFLSTFNTRRFTQHCRRDTRR